MARIVMSRKALSVRPLKASPPMGAVLALLGMARSMPLMHGSQGCSAFAKVYFTRHFHEPIPMQTTAMDQVSAVMGADANLKEALATVMERHKPDLVGVVTTGLTETEGVDLNRVLREFRREHPALAAIPVAAANTPDYAGSLETGYARMVEALVETLVPAASASAPRRSRPPRVNVLAGPALTPGDAETLHALAAAFGMEACLLPDLSGGMDGHLAADGFSTLTGGGGGVAEWAWAGEALVTVVVGRSLARAADLLAQRTGVPDRRFDELCSLSSWDELVMTLARVGGKPVPGLVRRQREQLQDALLDAHFLLSGARVALAGEPDWLAGWVALLREVGAVAVAVTAAFTSPVLAELNCPEIIVGDLDDWAGRMSGGEVDLAVGNSHAANVARSMSVPVVRSGYPVHDALGAFRRGRIGYQGARDTLFELADRLHEGGSHGIAPHVSELAATAFP